MYRIIILTILYMTSFGVNAQMCFKYQGKTYVFEKLSEKSVSITQKDNELLTRWFFCVPTNEGKACSGDDDSGEFKVVDQQIVLKPGLTLGEPDGPELQLKSSTPIDLMTCY